MKKMIYVLFILLIPFNVFALTYPKLHYQNAYLYDLTDDVVLYELNSDDKESIASLTKIMTTLVALDNIDNLNEKITYTQDMANLVRWDASVAGLKVGDQVTYKDLLYASILPSGADATTALAISTSGSITAFVQKMNDTAAQLGMKNTHFVNVTGLDASGHYSTAHDILILLKYAFQNESFKEIYTTKTYTLSNNLFVKSTLFSYHFSQDTSRILGSKTGFTADAGRCISVYFTSNSHEFLLVTLGAPGDANFYHIADALDLINFIDENYNEQIIVKENSLVKKLKVKNSKIDDYELKTNKSITKYLPQDYDQSKIKITYTGLEELSYKNKLKSKIGTASYYYDNELLASEDFYLNTEIKIDIFKVMYSYRIPLIIILIIIVFILVALQGIKRAKKRLTKVHSKQKNKI